VGDGLDLAVEQSIALMDDVGFVVGTGDHCDERVAALHDAANRDLAERQTRQPVASATDWARLRSGAEQVQERIAAAGGLVGERLGRFFRRRGHRFFPPARAPSAPPARFARRAARRRSQS
jgi:hypothetical protein